MSRGAGLQGWAVGWALVLLSLSVAPGVSLADRSLPIYVIDHPTAGILENGEYQLAGRLGPNSSVLMGLAVGFKGVFHVGVSFGMQRVFDRGSVEVNDQVGFKVKVRLLEEGVGPALAVGFNSQGQGFYHKDLERYDRKSPGFYAVLSKNYLVPVGEMTVHGGANYSTESKDDDDPDLFLALEWRPVERFGLLLDGDAALNDNVEGGAFGRGGIYLDAALRVDYGQSLSLMLIFRDLTGNFRPYRKVGRELELSLWDSF